jgi:acetyl esterase/lipase
VSGARGAVKAWNRLLPDLGFTVFDIDYRLPGDVPIGWDPRMEIGDVKCALGWTAAHASELGIDPTRISIMGASAGGNLALLAAYTSNDAQLPPTCDVPAVPVRSVVSVYGVADLTDIWEHTGVPDQVHSAMRRYLGGSPAERPDLYRLLSPSSHVRGDVPPTLQLAGEDDQLVPPRIPHRLERELEAAGAVHDERYLAAADHTFDGAWGSFTTQVARAGVADFLRRYG